MKNNETIQKKDINWMTVKYYTTQILYLIIISDHSHSEGDNVFDKWHPDIGTTIFGFGWIMLINTQLINSLALSKTNNDEDIRFVCIYFIIIVDFKYILDRLL